MEIPSCKICWKVGLTAVTLTHVLADPGVGVVTADVPWLGNEAWWGDTRVSRLG